MQKQINMVKLAGVDIMTICKEDLVDVRNLTFDTSIPIEQRAAWILGAVKNPYCFRVGDMGVKLEFLDNTQVLQNAFHDLLNRKQSGL